jgi:benzoyl-CoA reductase/2-hydroxyglutaryl-CoA dehydratase subunit BcrC/BadD/HgdB
LALADDYARTLAFGARFRGHGGLRVNAALIGLQREQLERERSGEAPTVWASPLVPSELLAAFGIASVTPETVAALLASAGAAGRLLDCARSVGLPDDCCSFQRTAVAALELGAVPVPRAFLSASSICDDNDCMSRFLARRHGREAFRIEVPSTDDDAAHRALEARLREMARFLERLSGRAPDPGRLAGAVGESNRARALWLEANRLRRDHPPVMYGVAALRLAGGLLLQKLGSPGLTAAMGEYVAELRERIGAEDFVPVRRRLLWLHLFPLYDGRFLHRIERELGMVVAFEESSHPWWDEIDPGDPFPGFARRMLGCPTGGPVSRRVEALKALAAAYRADGIVQFGHAGCRTLTGGGALVSRALREAGYPVLELDGDCLDDRTPANAAARTRVEAFAEMLG